MKPVVPQDKPPEDTLGFKARIVSWPDFDQALRLLAWLTSRIGTVKAAVKQKAALAKDWGEEQLLVTVGDAQVPAEKRLKQIEEAVRKFAGSSKHRDKILADTGKKSKPFTHATISYRDQPDRLLLAEETTDDEVVAILQKRSKLGKLPSATFLRSAVVLNWSSLVDGWKRGDVTEEQLEAIGIAVERDRPEQVHIKPHEYTVEPAAAPAS